ncbi:MAG: nucleotidyltransferase family protein [Candidatus Rokuibacteriota bacterium]
MILAAGIGARIQPLSLDYPKPLLPVCNRPIIHYQIDYMVRIGITRFVIVVHHLRAKLIDYFARFASLEADIRFVEQREPLGIAHAVGMVEKLVDGPFLLFLGDVFIVTKELDVMVEIREQQGAAAVLATKREAHPEYIRRNYAVVADETGLVGRVVEKPSRPTTDRKGCGIYLFGPEIFDAVRRTPRTALRDEYEITSAIQILIDDGSPVYAADIVDWDMNITVPDDLLACNLEALRRKGRPNLIGEAVKMHSGTAVENSIIGDNVWIQHAIEIRDSMVFSQSVVTAREALHEVIVTPSGMIRRSAHAGNVT